MCHGPWWPAEETMAIVYQITSITAAGDVITLTSGTDLTIAPGIIVGSESEDGVQGQGADHDVQVYGVVSGGDVGVELGADSTVDSNNVVRVMDEGSVYGANNGIAFFSKGNRVINDGNISSDNTAVSFTSAGAPTISHVTNRGTISGSSFAIFSSNDVIQVFNTGTIEAADFAIFGSGQNDTVKNDGTIIGSV